MKSALTSFRTLAIALASMLMCTAASAQNGKDYDHKPYPHMFVGLQGGGQTTLTDYSASKLITPIAGISFGAHFTPVVGVRVGSQGWKNKGGLQSIDQKYDFKYVQANLDLMLNLSNLLTGREYSKFNAYFIAGVGLAYGWGYETPDATFTEDMPLKWGKSNLTHNVRLGAQIAYDVCKNLDFNIEAGVNNMSDRINAHRSGSCDWQPYLMAGVTLKFGHRKKTKIEDVPMSDPRGDYQETVVTEQAATNTNTVIEPPAVAPAKIERDIFFGLDKDEISPAEMKKVSELIDFMKKNPQAKIELTGYADKETGNAKYNEGLSHRRMRKVYDELTNGGISASRISGNYKGDTVQPYADNDKNRVVICIAAE